MPVKPLFLLARAALAARGAFFLTVDPLLARVRRDAPAPQDRERVLIVRLDGIGDFVLWLEAARALRTRYPSDRYELVLLANPAWATLAEAAGAFDQVWTLQPRAFVWSLGERARQLRRIRAARFATIIQPRFSRELFVEDALTRASGAPERIAFERARDRETRIQKPISDRWYTRLLPPDPGDRTELERNARFAADVTGGGNAAIAAPPTLTPAQPLPQSLADRGDYFVLVPGAGWSGRQWPPERFAAIAARINAETGYAGVVCGGPGEEELGARVAALSDTPLLDLSGRTPLGELAAILAQARLVVTNETGSVHLAAAVGTPAVCILGGGHYGRFLPYPPAGAGHTGGALPLPVVAPMPCFGCDWNCIYPRLPGGATPCIDAITVDAVWDGVKQALAASATPALVAGVGRGVAG